MKKGYYRKGNIFKLKDGYKVIITSINDRGVNWISFNSSGTSGFTVFETEINETDCDECIMPYGIIDEECEQCNGSGLMKVTRHGMDYAEKLADNAEKYILDRLKKLMDL